MKQAIHYTCAVAVVSAIVTTGAWADNPSPAYVDFGKFSPPAKGGEFVEVQINNSLIAMVSRLAEKSEPEVAKLIRGLQSIHVNVIGLNNENRAEVEQRVKAIRSQLEAKKWDTLVTVRKDGQDVIVYLKTRGAEAVEGLAVTLLEGNRQAVLVNIVGDIKPEQIALIGEKFGLDPLKKLGKEIHKQ